MWRHILFSRRRGIELVLTIAAHCPCPTTLVINEAREKSRKVVPFCLPDPPKKRCKKKVQGAVVDQSAHSCNKRPDIISPRVNAYWKAVTHFVNRRVYIRGVWDVTTCNEGTIRFIFTRFYGGDYLTSAKVSFTFLSMFDIFFSVLSIRVKKYPFYRHIGHVPHK